RLNVVDIPIPPLGKRREDIRTACRELSSSAGPKSAGFPAEIWRRRRSEKPSPCRVSSRFPNRPIEKRAECAQKCAQTAGPKARCTLTVQTPLMVAFSVRGDGFYGDRLTRFRG